MFLGAAALILQTMVAGSSPVTFPLKLKIVLLFETIIIQENVHYPYVGVNLTSIDPENPPPSATPDSSFVSRLTSTLVIVVSWDIEDPFLNAFSNHSAVISSIDSGTCLNPY